MFFLVQNYAHTTFFQHFLMPLFENPLQVLGKGVTRAKNGNLKFWVSNFYGHCALVYYKHDCLKNS